MGPGSSKILDKINRVDAKLIPAKEKIIIFERNGRFYTLRYINTDAEFAKFDEAFKRAVNTIKFKDSK